MGEYVSRVLLEVDGAAVDDFDAITLPEEEVRQQEMLMNRAAQFEVTPNLSPIDVVYAIPKDREPFDWQSVRNGTLTVDLQNGTRIKYTGVSFLKEGTTSFDKGLAKTTISLGATGKVNT
jgi:hypothetical protein